MTKRNETDLMYCYRIGDKIETMQGVIDKFENHYDCRRVLVAFGFDGFSTLFECSKITETRRDITANYYEFTIRRLNGDEFKYEVSGNEFCYFEYSDFTREEWEYWVNNRIV
jgi:hypothetical protein